jgi:hypothetical protein
METSLMKSKIHQYIDKADEDFLALIYGLIESNHQEKTYRINAEELTLMEERLLDYERDPSSGSSWEEVKNRLLSR